MAGRILPAIRLRAPQQQSPAPACSPTLESPRQVRTTILVWRTGDRVLWNGYTGTFLRETVDDHAEVPIGTRTYRMPKAELRSA